MGLHNRNLALSSDAAPDTDMCSVSEGSSNSSMKVTVNRKYSQTCNEMAQWRSAARAKENHKLHHDEPIQLMQ